MEDQEKLSLNHLAIESLRVSGKWCMFLAIVGFIFIALMVVAGIGITAIMSAMPTELPNDPYNQMGMQNPVLGMGAWFGAIYIIFALVYFFPVYYLFNYAKGIKQALDFQNADTLAKALESLKSHHKFLGIFTIVMIALYIVFIIGFAAFAASFASSMRM
ncbi:DUF5362 family protein [Flavobacterium terrisoli]|uniref:DUF5362 family protein n=1 Tax=Flavobacterium terrisoli TaxID=3242195 RepID=UPI0025436212|nr:DUF5362 family protein [Flavobacterium buctense]